MSEPLASQSTENSAADIRVADWRVRMSLAPTADYLYKAPTPGILAPLV